MALTAYPPANWMWLLINANCNGQTGWEGYDYIDNRTIDADGSALERNAGGWKWQKVTKVDCRTEGNELHLAVPRSAKGVGQGSGELRIDFKWADNLQHTGDAMDFYVSGDVVPEGRFMYRYLAK